LKIDTAYNEGKIVMVVFGAIDNFTYPIFAKEINILMRTGALNICVDFNNCSDLNVATVKLLDNINFSLGERNGHLEVMSMNTDENELFELMKRSREIKKDESPL
jgi:hypothetical protein